METLFEKIKVNSLKYKARDLPKKPCDNFTLPALTAGIQNQGLNNFVEKENATILKNLITISANGANTGATFYQNREFTVLQDSYAINWKYTNDILTDNQYLYLATTIKQKIYGNYEWTNKAGWEKIKTEIITLPINNKKIDFEFMESFIAELEAYHIAELEAYLEITGLKDYTLTENEKNLLNLFEQGKIKFKEYKVKDVFDIISYKKRFDANKVTISSLGKHPYIVRTSLNNGIRGYIDENEKYLNDGNTISFGQDTATMFYQKQPYFTGDKIKIVKSKYANFNQLHALFFITTMAKSFSSFSWGNASFSVNIIENQYITIPTCNEKPDYKLMETFISVIQKLVIKDVVLYTERKINSTKDIVNN